MLADLDLDAETMAEIEAALAKLNIRRVGAMYALVPVEVLHSLLLGFDADDDDIGDTMGEA